MGLGLLAVEVLGVLLLFVSGDYATSRSVEPLKAAGVLVGALLLWAAPNAWAFYKARSLFVEDAEPKK